MKDTNAPKRAMSGYMLFAESKRSEVKTSNPDVPMTGLSTIFGKLWQEASEEEKRPFVEKSAALKEEYNKKLEAYKQTPEYADFQKNNKMNKLIHKYAVQLGCAKKKYKGFPRDPNGPKKAASAYMLYAASVRPNLMKENHGAAMSVIGKKIGQMWTNIDIETKAKFEKLAVKAKAEHRVAIQKYQQTPKYHSYISIREQFEAERKKMLKKSKKTE